MGAGISYIGDNSASKTNEGEKFERKKTKTGRRAAPEKTSGRNSEEKTEKISDIVCGEADAIGYVYRKDNKTLISFVGGDNAIRGSRPLHLREKVFQVAESDDKGNIKVDMSQIFLDTAN